MRFDAIDPTVDGNSAIDSEEQAMWAMIQALAEMTWQVLPELAIVMRFITALIGLAVAATRFVRLIRGWNRRRSHPAPSRRVSSNGVASLDRDGGY